MNSYLKTSAWRLALIFGIGLLVSLAATLRGADPTYNNDKLLSFSKTTPAGTETPDTIDDWIRNKANSLYDAFMSEHNATGGHRSISLFFATNALSPQSVTLLATNTGGFFGFYGANTNEVFLPSSASSGPGKLFAFKRTDANTNQIAIFADTGDAVDGATSYLMTNAWESLLLVSDGITNWFRLDKQQTSGGGGTTYTSPTKAWLSWAAPKQAISSLVQVGGNAMATMSGSHYIETGWTIRISGAAVAAYNTNFVVTNVTSSVLYFAIGAGTASPSGGSPVLDTAIRSSYNVSCFEAVAAGNYKVTFTTPLTTSNYMAAATGICDFRAVNGLLYPQVVGCAGYNTNTVEIWVNHNYGGWNYYTTHGTLQVTVPGP